MMAHQNIEDLYPLSPMQQGMLFHSLYAPETGNYFEQSTWELHGSLDPHTFQRAWQKVLDRHAALRTGFVWEEVDEPLQVVYRTLALPFTFLDWQGRPAEEQAEGLRQFLHDDQQSGFDLADAPLMRMALIQVGSEDFHFIWSHHHLLLDGWSQPILLGEVLAFYDAFHQGRELALPPARPFSGYIAWLQEQDPAQAEAFWRAYLKGFYAASSLNLPLSRMGETGVEEDYAIYSAALPEALTGALNNLAQGGQLTLNTIVQGALGLLLSRYTRSEDVVFGATVSGRPTDLPGAGEIVGLFINTLPVRARVSSQERAVDYLKRLQANNAGMRQFEYSPLVEIQRWSEVRRDLPLFETLLVFENYPVAEPQGEQANRLQVRRGAAFTRTNYPLTVAVSPGKAIGVELAYDRTRFDEPAIQRMLGHFQTILAGFAAQPEARLGSIPMLTAAEQQELAGWNPPPTPFPHDQTAVSLFEAQVERTPDAPALVFNGQTLSYAELNRRANQLARRLQKQGIGLESLAAICAGRSFEMIVAALAVMKAGGAYVPIDPDYPPERIAFILEDTHTALLLTQSHLAPRLPLDHLPDGARPQVICLDEDARPADGEDSANLPLQAGPLNLAYVIYTSGSTGKPKGTLLQHRGLVNFSQAFGQALGVNPNTRFLQFASFAFDASVAEIFPTLLSGAALYLAERDTLVSVPELSAFIQENRVDTATMPPSLLRLLPPEDVRSLRAIAAVGEALPVEVARKWATGRLLLNGYGPTEATCGSAWQAVETPAPGDTRVPIGSPVANSQSFVLDADLNFVPVGVAGELHIGGAGLARGYLNRPELTAEKFIPSPFNAIASSPWDERLYKTGDLVRWLPDGRLDFIGRVDHQVKLRGFRVELGEIDALLSQHPAVSQAVTIARQDEDQAGGAAAGEKYLAAYVVLETGAQAGVPELREFLKERLPGYMVPWAYVVLDELPLTSSGKIDRKALPAPAGGRSALREDFIAPRTPVEAGLAEIWMQVLGLERVGVQDNFFELGGHSLLATQLMSRVQAVFAVNTPLRELFEQPTIAGLAGQVEAALRTRGQVGLPDLARAERGPEMPLSFAQQRLWILDQLEPGSLFYNIPMAVRLQGQLEVSALQEALGEIVRRHEALRTTFAARQGKPVQVIAGYLPLEMEVEDLQALPAEERLAGAQRLATDEARTPFDLEHGPLLRVRLLRLDEEDHVALLTMHHIVSDGWSLNVLVRELALLYDAFSQGRPSPLPELPVQYADFAAWQRQWLQGELFQDQLDYWKAALSGSPELLELPTDHPRPAVQTSNGATYNFSLPGALGSALRSLGQEERATLFMVLVAAYQVLLYRYSGQADFNVGTPIANRSRPEIEGLIGFFVNTLVLRAQLEDGPTFRETLARVREQALGAYAHQDLPFEALVEALQPQRNLSHTPLFQTMFVLDTPQSGEFQLPRLKLTALEAHSGKSTFDLTLSVTDTPQALAAYFEYNTDLFSEDTIRRMANSFTALLEGIVADPDQPVTHLPVMSAAELSVILDEWNRTQAVTPAQLCAHQLFEMHAARRPDAPALILGEGRLSYGELNARANQAARHLQTLGVRRGALVAIAAERSFEMLIGILGALKAGAAYLPLDPTYPAERLSFMLADSQAPVLLTQAHLEAGLPAHTARVVRLDQDWPLIAAQDTSNLDLALTSDDLAYVIYTSGSTGRPKGALLRHKGLSNLAEVHHREFGVEEGCRVLQFSPFSFDASVWETIMALGNGAALVLARQETLAAMPELARLMREQQVTHVTLPPSVLHVLPAEDLPALRTVVAAGEACPPDLVQRWAPGRRFFNAYGPTETTVCASMYRCDPDETAAPPIGRPLSNTRLYVLDAAGQPAPLGAAGELLVSGPTLARGYLNRPEMTAEKFIANPFAARLPEPEAAGLRGEYARLYRTGDLVRYRGDGNIEFLGRIDHQVKVRGFRIELGEIENALARHPVVREALALAREDTPGDKRLVAYLVLNAAGWHAAPEAAQDAALSGSPAGVEAPRPQELRAFLRQSLPEYMIPSAFVILPEFPLSPSGKIERKLLPAPEGGRAGVEHEYVAPRSPDEEKLAAICGELLGIPQVGVFDNFFELGGHSLLATQFISRVQTAFGIEMPLRALFEHPSVAEFAQALALAQTQQAAFQAPAIQAVSREGRRVKRSALGGGALPGGGSPDGGSA